MLANKGVFSLVMKCRIRSWLLGTGIFLLLVGSTGCADDPLDSYRDRVYFQTIDMTIYPPSPIQLKIADDMSPFYQDNDSPTNPTSFNGNYSSGFGTLRSR
jgi:hypothetical protein